MLAQIINQDLIFPCFDRLKKGNYVYILEENGDHIVVYCPHYTFSNANNYRDDFGAHKYYINEDNLAYIVKSAVTYNIYPDDFMAMFPTVTDFIEVESQIDDCSKADDIMNYLKETYYHASSHIAVGSSLPVTDGLKILAYKKYG